MIETLSIELPRPVTALHQIEITSVCNLRCKYCVHPTMSRAKAHMSMETFSSALRLVYHYKRYHGQHELNLCGIGESTVHPQFIEFLGRAHATRVRYGFSTSY